MIYLTPEEQKEIKDMESMFASEGWKRFIEIQGEALKALPERSLYASDEKELFFLKGQFHIIKQLVEYEEMYFKSAEAMNEERQIEADNASDSARLNRAANA